MFNSYDADLNLVTKALFETILLRDPGTAHHSLSVAYYCEQFAISLNLPDYSEYYRAGLLHDIGKIGMADSILKSSDKLNPEQRKSLVNHVIDGERILRNLGFGQLVLDVTKYHHERVDASGYLGLHNNDIPLPAKIAGIVDSYDAIVDNRAYSQKVFDKSEAISRLMRSSEKYDPYLLKRFCAFIVSEEQGSELYPLQLKSAFLG